MFAAARAGGTTPCSADTHSSPQYCNLEESLSSGFPGGDNTQPLLLLSQCRWDHYLYFFMVLTKVAPEYEYVISTRN